MKLLQKHQGAINSILMQHVKHRGETLTRTIDEDGFYALVGQSVVAAFMWEEGTEVTSFGKGYNYTAVVDGLVGWNEGATGVRAGWSLSTWQEHFQGLTLNALKDHLKALNTRPNVWIKIAEKAYDTGIPAARTLEGGWAAGDKATALLSKIKAGPLWSIKAQDDLYYSLHTPTITDCGISMVAEGRDLLGAQHCLRGAEILVQAVGGHEIEIIFQKGDKNVRT